VRVDGEDNGFVYDVLVGAANLVGQFVDAVAHLVEVRELLVGQFLEDCVGLDAALHVDQTHLQGPPGADA